MKTFNRLFGSILLAFGLVAMGSLATRASVVARSPKEVYVLSYTTTVSTVTPAISSNAATNAAFQPGAVYQLLFSTGAAGEYFEMYDSTGTVGISCGAPANGSAQLLLGPRFMLPQLITSTTTSGVVFDPPLVFHNGLVACDSAVTGQTSISYELGRGLSGN